MRRLIPCFLLLFLSALLPSAHAQLTLPTEQPIHLGRFPALSPDGKSICFSYQGNLWVSPIKGGPATRLTANDSYDSQPRWSPDGNWIAFRSDREGGNQIFLIPAVGGAVRQLTFHSAATSIYDWFPDGRSLLVTSSRATQRSSLYRLDVMTGRLTLLLTDENNCYFPALSPDGKWIAYTRGALLDTIRKNYKGAANFDIWIAPVDGSAPPRRLTDSDKNDMWPCWSGDGKTIFYTSERAGLATVWKQPFSGGKPTQVVTSPPDAVRWLAIARNGSDLVYECDDRICVIFTKGGPAVTPPILCRTDERGPHATYATYSGSNVSEYELSPDGKRMAFVVRGDIFVVTIEKGGEAKRLTDNPTRDGDMAWSPDGKALVYASNRDGGFHLYTVNVATKETHQLTKGSATDTNPFYSPDGKWIAFRRGPKTGLSLIKPDGTGEQVVVKGPDVNEFHWSPDSKWLTYMQEDAIRNEDIWIVGVTPDGQAMKVGTPLNVSDHPGFNNRPQWFADGKKLAFLSNRYHNRDIETINDNGRYTLYTVPLEREKDKFEEDEDAPKPAEKPGEKKKDETVVVKIDPAEIERRAKQIVGLDEGVGAYSVSPDGKTVVFNARSLGTSDLWQVGTDGGAVQRLTTNGTSTGDFEWTPDSSRFYFLSGGAIHWLPRGGGAMGTVGFTVRMEIDRLVDYKATFDEAWQILNDRYYDPKFHGADWNAQRQKYRDKVDYVTVRPDFNYLMTELLGELNSSHTGFNGGASRPARETGYLGIWHDDAYEGPGIKVKTVLHRSPADHEESLLKAGDYILSIDGQDVKADSTYDKAMAEKVGRTVTLLVNSKPDKIGARTVKIKPISSGTWRNLLYEKWLDERRATVEKSSGGRLGYLHVPDMGDAARNRFERELFSVGQRKEGMIIDLRFNNGGDTHDSLLKILERNRHYFTFAPRTEAPFPQPERAYTKPIILLVNEFALSDAEVFTDGFKELKLGKVLGTPTMGWIIFTSGTGLLDGSFMRIPFMGCYTLDGRDMENWGVPPDILVENTPAAYLAGHDTQLERAAEELLKDPHLTAK
ncbi:MAG: Tricorn protease [Chthonomonadaceae bacterium]|nr:Tricorn protease [Chthonomonadaceae bacterium]